ncbi:MAG: hypothetical protein ACR5LD_07360 [Symbiopectobacterium sp.]
MIKVVAPKNQGSALATYTMFLDLFLGLDGTQAGGVMMGYTGVDTIYLAAAVLLIRRLADDVASESPWHHVSAERNSLVAAISVYLPRRYAQTVTPIQP